MTTPRDPSRRHFLRVAVSAGGALVIGLGGRHAAAAESSLPSELIGDELMRLGPFVMIERDNRVVIGARACEVGQGVRTSGPMLVAEELDVDWSQVRVIQLGYGYDEVDGRPDDRYGAQSGGLPADAARDWSDLRMAGARARALLLRSAADVWQVPVESLRTQSGYVIDGSDRRLSYGALARSAASLQPADAVTLKEPADFRLVGKPARTSDAADIVRGRTRYASDEFLTGMLVAVVARCPHPGGTLEGADEAAARKVPGVRDVVRFDGSASGVSPLAPLAAGIAVLADTTWAALEARARLAPTWKPAEATSESSARLVARAHERLDGEDAGLVVRKDGDLAASRKRARHQVKARYELPFLAHAMLEAPAVAVELRQDGAVVIAAVQDPDATSRLVSDLTGLPRGAIDIRLPRGGGSFGRRLANDFVAEAIIIAKLAGKPVRLMWTQADDLGHDFLRPLSVHALSATLDRGNRIAGWSHDCAGTPRNDRGKSQDSVPAWDGCLDADAFPAGLVAHFEQHFHPLDSTLPRGAWRATADTAQAFATQCFIDEIAFEVRRDAVALRLELLGEARVVGANGGAPGLDTARMASVLKRCAEAIQWNSRRRDGRGVGIACHAWAGGCVAHAFETAMDGDRLRIERAVCVIDAGRVVNPLGLEGEVAAATVDGIATALHLAITTRDGQVQQRNLQDYRIMAMAQAPARVEVHIVESASDPVPAGDLAFNSVAPALANAIFATTTVRVRKLPLMPELLRML
ncbi:MAG: xanthine dehydrogenase family protein molybdopterin-binding subunit [Xanthomonadales bacterium]|nr:xanthine dehydrogenase family protein molybdopterin-binding subunit [Xanthomonadales bacterium]